LCKESFLFATRDEIPRCECAFHAGTVLVNEKGSCLKYQINLRNFLKPNKSTQLRDAKRQLSDETK
jgi:hypothetical protein